MNDVISNKTIEMKFLSYIQIYDVKERERGNKRLKTEQKKKATPAKINTMCTAEHVMSVNFYCMV